MVDLYCESFAKVRNGSRSISTTRSTPFTAASNCGCSTPKQDVHGTADRGVRRRGPLRHRGASSRQTAERQGEQALLALDVRAIRAHWPNIEILLRADSHYWWPGSSRLVSGERHRLYPRRRADLDLASPYDVENEGAVRGHHPSERQAGGVSRSSMTARRVGAGSNGHRSRRSRHGRTRQPLRRHQLAKAQPRTLYEVLYCRRGQAETTSSLKTHLAADRTSCTKATVNQFGYSTPAPTG